MSSRPELFPHYKPIFYITHSEAQLSVSLAYSDIDTR